VSVPELKTYVVVQNPPAVNNGSGEYKNLSAASAFGRMDSARAIMKISKKNMPESQGC
jgi:hypothetical protein